MKKIKELQKANKRKNQFSNQKVKDSRSSQNYEVFMWSCCRIHKKGRETAVFFKEGSSFTGKNHQTKKSMKKKKSGKKPSLSTGNCLFLTLI